MADGEFGEWKARKLTRQLAAFTANQQIQGSSGKKQEDCGGQCGPIEQGCRRPPGPRKKNIHMTACWDAGDDRTTRACLR